MKLIEKSLPQEISTKTTLKMHLPNIFTQKCQQILKRNLREQNKTWREISSK